MGPSCKIVAASLPALALAAIPLSGYFCAECPSNTNPSGLIGSIPAGYSTVIFAFAGWDANGNVQDQTGYAPKGFILTQASVNALRASGRRVLISLGGASSALWTDAPPAGFVETLIAGLVNITTFYNTTGMDFDIEHRSGDMIQCGVILTQIIAGYKKQLPNAFISFAPSMVDLYPQLNTISPGFNAQLPPINASFHHIELLQMQMYNTWAQAETIQFATQYAQSVMAGFSASGDGQTFSLSIPPRMLALGYPASPQGASSGFIDPTQVVAMVCQFRTSGQLISLMTWDIGWDQQAGWQFVNAVAAAPCS